MSTEQPIRRQVSEVLGVMIPKDGWKKSFYDLDRAGKIDHRTLMDIMVVILMNIESYETPKSNTV